jgi:hypothetical protein
MKAGTPKIENLIAAVLDTHVWVWTTADERIVRWNQAQHALQVIVI